MQVANATHTIINSGRDPTHAAGRFLISWKADTFMWRTYQLLVAAKGSPSKLVQHSPALADIFGRHIQELETCPVRGSRVRKMKYVKHRFNSSAVPLQRSILFFEAVWRFCMECLAVRAGTEPAKQAGEFLQNVTEEAVIQAAVMAEAADEHLLLRRWFDSDAWDAASIGRQIDSFLNKLRYLFVPPGGPAGSGKAGCENHGVCALCNPNAISAPCGLGARYTMCFGWPKQCHPRYNVAVPVPDGQLDPVDNCGCFG